MPRQVTTLLDADLTFAEPKTLGGDRGHRLAALAGAAAESAGVLPLTPVFVP